MDIFQFSLNTNQTNNSNYTSDTNSSFNLSNISYTHNNDIISDNQYNFIQSLCKRLESILPNHSGHTLQEIEIDPQFIITRNILLNFKSKNVHFMSSILTSFASILKIINNESKNIKLRSRDEKSRTSTLLLLNILADIIEVDWNRSLITFTKDKEVISNYSKFYHYEVPRKLNIDMISGLIDLFLNMLSSGIVKKILALVKNEQSFIKIATATTKQDEEQLQSQDDDLVQSQIDDIDTYLGIILSYIATANPVEYLNYVETKLYRFSKINENIPLPTLQKYCPLIKFLFYSKENVLKAGENGFHCLSFIKSTTWKQVFLFMIADAVKDQSFSRPSDYYELVDIDNHQQLQVARNFFDATFALFDENLTSISCASFVLTWYVVLCIDDFGEMISNKPLNKLKTTFNKRLKYLTMILKDSSNASNLESFDALINIFHLGARLQTYNYDKHPVYLFSLRYLDETHSNLLKFGEFNKDKFENDDQLKMQYEFLIVNYYIVAILLRPDKYIKVVIHNYKLHSHEIKATKTMVKIIQRLSEIETAKSCYQIVMKELTPTLKSIIFGCLKILNNYENQEIQSISVSSQASAYSDSVLVDPNEMKANRCTQMAFDKIKTDLDHYSDDSDIPSTHLIQETEQILADIFTLFLPAPELYFNDVRLMNDENLDKIPYAQLLGSIIDFVHECVIPLRLAFKFKYSVVNNNLFDSAKELSIRIVQTDTKIASDYTTLSAFANFNICNCIIQSICETCLALSLSDSKFKFSFLFLNKFLQMRNEYSDILLNNKILMDPKSRDLFETCGDVIHGVEKVLLLSLCTHDAQFYNYAKQGIVWYLNEVHINSSLYTAEDIQDNLIDTFEELHKEDRLFTGFVSLHKKHRDILREAKPTLSLYQVWFMIYNRWKKMLENSYKIESENNLIFRHFTGFLVSTSGCFISGKNQFFADSEIQSKCCQNISDFFDRCIGLLISPNLVVRVIIKDILSNESHSDVYHLIATKLMNTANSYTENKNINNDEVIVFLEHALVIMTAMINVKNEGALLLSSLLPVICQFFIKFINEIKNDTDNYKLKLKFSKLIIVLESDRKSTGLSGAYKLRNFYAKSICEWLEQAILSDEIDFYKESEISYLAIDFAVHCSKAIKLQLECLLLEIPEGIKDKEIKKYKDLAFSNYFSLFYKIIQKYTKTSSKSKFKHKLQLITDNVLSSITNLLQYDSEIGIQFVLPMGYHENKKIRAIFLNVFADMLQSQSMKTNQEEYPNELIFQLTDNTDIFGSIAETASSLEHNLLASSLFGIFTYTNNLRKLFQILLNDEITKLNRATDLFRRNSTLTRLLFNFTQEYGLNYLNQVLSPIIEEIITKEVQFEVEKKDDPESAKIFLSYFTRMVDSIVDSFDSLPNPFKIVCGNIYQCVNEKFGDSALVAVGSFLFLRFFCPAIINPEQYFKLDVQNVKVKRSLMQLVKVLQNMANGAFSSIAKWPSLANKNEQLDALNKKIYVFLNQVSTLDLKDYPFTEKREKVPKPLAEIKYLHKFIYQYFTSIRSNFILGKSAFGINTLQKRVECFKKFDEVVMKLGQPKPSVKLQLSTSMKLLDNNNNNDEEENKYNDFMTKMSLRYTDVQEEASDVIHSSIFKDGTPAVVVNLKRMRDRHEDIDYLVFKLFETASQVWDNKFYLVYDFSEFYFFTNSSPIKYAQYFSTYSLKNIFENCQRVYYFNIPRTEYRGIINAMISLRSKGAQYGTKIYTYSSMDPDNIVGSLCLDPETVSISRDAKVTFNNVILYEPSADRFIPVKLKIGRKFLTICFQEKLKLESSLNMSEGFTPVEVYRLSDFVKCEISNTTGYDDEFTIYLNHSSHVTLRSHDRLEILRFLYFTTSRLPREFTLTDHKKDYQSESHVMHWFGRLYNIVFQGLLNDDEELKSSAALLFGSLSSYFNIDFGITESHAKYLPFPTDATNFVVNVSNHLSSNFPQMTFRFFKAFFDNYEKMDIGTRSISILYISPWIGNVYDFVYLQYNGNGPNRVADLVRQFCRLSVANKEHVAFINDYIWKKLFQEARMVSTLVDEVVAFAIDSKNEGPDWSFIISVINPSIEVCGEVILRLVQTINVTVTTDSAIASQSKLFEIEVLIKICSTLFFNSFTLSRLYLADIIFFVTLFIDNDYLDVGHDLQKLIISSVQSFLHKPSLTNSEQNSINETIEYFTTPRAKMLFGMTRDLKSSQDVSQSFNRISNFEILCDYLNEVIDIVSTSDDKTNWRSRWASNSIDVAFNNFSLFQDRAVLIVGILSKSGINDSTACRSLKLISKGELHNIGIVICCSIAIARILDGLPTDSVLPPILIWPQFCFALMNYSVLYQPAIQNLITSVVKIMDVPKYFDFAFEQRQLLEPYLSEFEKRHDIYITQENFGVYIFFILTQGLKTSHVRHLALCCVKTYLKKRFSIKHIRPIDGTQINTNALAYLVFIYLCSDTKDFENFMQQGLNLPVEYIEYSNQKLPKLICEFLLQQNEAAKVTLLHLGCFYSDIKGADIGFKARFIKIYQYIFANNKTNALYIYHLIKNTLYDELVNTVSLEVVEDISDIITSVSLCNDYKPEIYHNDIEQLLIDKKITIVMKLRTMQPPEQTIDEDGKFKPHFAVDIKSIQVMLYRAACNYVDGCKLEN
ncbi:unnamed protein product [Candida verbasci]|uniref:Ras-GAP domain-containing protein n=1 Tax=Candida verbasci TaxID=1227364 RepID=A0A9W4X9D9_9ASCO|nr:unnamed protein product [Candida verbasci]